VTIHARVRAATLHALHHRPDRTWKRCETCNGMRLVIQITPEMHDAWVAEARTITGRPVHTVTHYLCVPVQQLPHLPVGTVQVRDCWDCGPLPTFPEDPEALARFLR